MRKNLAALVLAALISTPAAASAGVNVYVQPPSVVIGPSAPAPGVGISVVFPALPPSIVIQPGQPAYWFWDEGRGQWFSYDAKHRRHYSRDHEFVDDDRHFYVRENGWHKAREDNGLHKGWYKHKKHEGGRGRGHEGRENDRGDGRGEHGHGDEHGHGRGHDRD